MNAKYSGNYSYAIALIAACALLTGCAATSTQVKVPVPVECKEPVPDRPVMPTEGLASTATLDQFAQAAMAEIERREGYEVELLTALQACRTPIDALMPSLPSPFR